MHENKVSCICHVIIHWHCGFAVLLQIYCIIQDVCQSASLFARWLIASGQLLCRPSNYMLVIALQAFEGCW